MFQRVIVPLDGTKWSENALEYGAGVAEKFGARLTLVHAYKGAGRVLRDIATMQTAPDATMFTDQHVYDSVLESAAADESRSRVYLERCAASLAGRGIAVDTRVIDAPALEAILEEVNRERDTLVVMCTHGRTGLGRLIAGSVAQHLLQESRVPVLLIRHPNSAITAEGVDTAMDISIGADVMGKTGKLGEVHRVIVDARTDHITDLVVKHGFVFGSDRIVPLSDVNRVENGVVFVNLDEREFEAKNGYTDDRYRAPDPDYIGPPGFDHGDFLIDVLVAGGAASGPSSGSPPLGFPGGEQVSPDDMQRPAVSIGTPIVDVNGEKVGEVGEISLSPDDGTPTRVTLRRGRLFHHEMDLPLNWVDELSDKGITLNVAKSDVEALTRSAKS